MVLLDQVVLVVHQDLQGQVELPDHQEQVVLVVHQVRPDRVVQVDHPDLPVQVDLQVLPVQVDLLDLRVQVDLLDLRVQVDLQDLVVQVVLLDLLVHQDLPVQVDLQDLVVQVDHQVHLEKEVLMVWIVLIVVDGFIIQLMQQVSIQGLLNFLRILLLLQVLQKFKLIQHQYQLLTLLGYQHWQLLDHKHMFNYMRSELHQFLVFSELILLRYLVVFILLTVIVLLVMVL